jgi:purine-binding chemotaxis protein CheW
VREVLRIPQSVVDPPPPIVAGISSDYIEGVGKMDDRLLILLNLEKALSSQELQAL